MKRSPLTLTIAFLLIIAFGLMLFVFQVRKSEVAVVTLFGNLEKNRVKTEPGPYLQWPWPIEKVYKLDERVQSLEGKMDELNLPDHTIIMLSTYVGWRIQDPYTFFPQFAKDDSMSDAQSKLEPIVRSAELAVAGHHTFSDFLSADQTQMKLPQIEDEILAKVRDSVRNYGVEISFVQIKSIELPQSNTEDVFGRMKKEREKVIAKIDADAKEAASKITSDADSQAAKLLAEADARAKEIRGEGQTEMVKSLQILCNNPPFANFIISLDLMEGLNKEKTTWILDSSTPGLDVLQNPKKSEPGTK